MPVDCVFLPFAVLADDSRGRAEQRPVRTGVDVSDPTQADEARPSKPTGELFDAVVIGTGFGGAVAACRLAQAGKSVCILERGRRYGPGDFPRPAQRPDKLPHTARWAWAIGYGLWDVRDLQGTLAVQAAGYGGGSLVYANVHLRAPAQVFSSGGPAAYTRTELDRYYDVVAAVLRVRPLPRTPSSASGLTGPLPKEEAMLRAATNLDRAPCFLRPV